MSKEPKRNVYVGHRYVPKVMGEWDKTETYEGLSIVTNEGTSYTSKKRVPKGIDILNEEYWVVTGNYNAQIEEYRKDVRELEKDLNALETGVGSEIERLDQKDEEINSQLEHIAIQVNSNNIDDTLNIQNALNQLKINGGGTLLLPDELYLTNTLSVSDSENITIQMNGGIIKQLSSLVNGTFNVLNSKNIRFEKIRLEGTGLSVDRDTGYDFNGIRVQNSENIVLQKSEIFNMSSGGILVTNTNNVKINDNYFHGNLDMFDVSFGYGTPSKALNDVWIENNLCHSLNRYGVHVQGFCNNVAQNV